LHFIHAYSGTQALEIIEDMGSSIAIILLDVVMGADDAGLTVAKIKREEIRVMEPRIILRTGQLGYAPKSKSLKITLSMTTKPSLLEVNCRLTDNHYCFFAFLSTAIVN
jgi:DNA-binding LytR/AlgR family response regulator